MNPCFVSILHMFREYCQARLTFHVSAPKIFDWFVFTGWLTRLGGYFRLVYDIGRTKMPKLTFS